MCRFVAAASTGNDGDLLLADPFCIVAEHTLCPDNRTELGCNTDNPCSISSTALSGRLMSFFMRLDVTRTDRNPFYSLEPGRISKLERHLPASRTVKSVGNQMTNLHLWLADCLSLW
jgi:hypothetical protein